MEHARLNYHAHVLRLRARSSDTPRDDVLELRPHGAHGTLTSPARQLIQSCDWSAFD